MAGYNILCQSDLMVEMNAPIEFPLTCWKWKAPIWITRVYIKLWSKNKKGPNKLFTYEKIFSKIVQSKRYYVLRLHRRCITSDYEENVGWGNKEEGYRGMWSTRKKILKRKHGGGFNHPSVKRLTNVYVRTYIKLFTLSSIILKYVFYFSWYIVAFYSRYK